MPQFASMLEDAIEFHHFSEVSILIAYRRNNRTFTIEYMTTEPDYIEITEDTLEMSLEDSLRQNKKDIETEFSYFNPFFLLLAAILIGVFGVQIVNGLFTLSLQEWVDMSNFTYAYSNYRIGGNYGGIFTSMFLHGWVEHLIGNLLFLYVLGLVSFRIVGFYRSMYVYFITGLCAGTASFYLGSVPSIGASGAIFGLFWFVSMYYLFRRRDLSENLSDLSWVMVIAGILQIISWFATPYIDNYAHLGGFVAGCIMGYIQFRGDEKSEMNGYKRI